MKPSRDSLGIATTDGDSNATVKRGYRGITLGFIQRPRPEVVSSGLQNYRGKTPAMNLRLQVSQDLPCDPATSRTRSHKHPLYLGAPLIHWHKRTAAHRLVCFSCNHEISASLFEFVFI